MAAPLTGRVASDVKRSRLDDLGLFMRLMDEKIVSEITLDFFKKQNVSVLRAYLIFHGVQCSDMGKAYTKEKLALLAFNAWKMRLESIDGDKEDKMSLIRDKHLTPEGKMLPLVSSIKNGWSNNLDECSNFTYPDLYNYLIMKPGYDHEGLKAFKGLLGYKLFLDGHVRQITHFRASDFNYSFIKFQVYPH